MREEDNKLLFQKFYYYFNDNDPNDQFNSKEKKFNNPHMNLKINNNSINSNTNSLKYLSKNSNSINKEKLLQERNTMYNSNNQKKFNKLKFASVNSTNSSNSLNKHYRHVSSNNSTSNSSNNNSNSQQNVINQLKGKRTNSLLNFKY